MFMKLHRHTLYQHHHQEIMATPDLSLFVGKYECVSASNYEAFLADLKVNFFLRKCATFCAPAMDVEVDEGTGVWTISTRTTLKAMDIKGG